MWFAGWDKVFDFVGDPFIHPIFRPKERKANETYLGVCARFATFRNITKLRACYQEETYCHRKKFSFTGRYLLSQEEIYWHRKKYTIIRTKFDVTGNNIGINFVELGSISPQKINFLLQKEMYCHRKKSTVTGRI